MKSKYIINPGLAFAENSLIERLNRNARNGWLLEKFTFAGFFLKLNKGTPTDEIYCMDIRKKVDNDYYKIFETAGWKHVSTGYEMYHFFQAPKGTTAIYTDSITSKEKNADIQKITGMGALFSGIIFIIVLLIQFFTVNTIPFLAPISMIVSFISLIVFIFCFMPWVAYRFRFRSK